MNVITTNVWTTRTDGKTICTDCVHSTHNYLLRCSLGYISTTLPPVSCKHYIQKEDKA